MARHNGEFPWHAEPRHDPATVLADRLAANSSGQVRGEAALGLARHNDDWVGAALSPAQSTVTAPRWTWMSLSTKPGSSTRAFELDLKPERVRALYEEVASRYPLRLAWLS